MNRRERREAWATAAAVTLLGLAYVAHPARGTEAAALAERFVRPLASDGLSLDGGHVVAQARSGAYTDWTHAVAREAFVRWRHRGEFPELWNRLHARWGDGFWTAPAPEELDAVFAANLRAWEQARRGSAASSWRLEGGGLPDAGWSVELQPEAVRRGDSSPDRRGALVVPVARDSGGVSLVLRPGGAATAELGTELRLVFGAEDLADPSSAPTLYWATDQLAVSRWRAKGGLAVVDKEEGTATLTYDFSGEPGWFTPGARCTLLRLDAAPRHDRLVIVAVEGGG